MKDICKEDCECAVCRKEAECPKCKVKLVIEKSGIESDGTEWKELRCPKCGKKYGDIKMPTESFFGLENKMDDNPTLNRNPN